MADCPKLKETNFKGNKLKDKRLEKMVNGCPTKSVLEYLRAGGRGKGKGKQQDGEVSEKVDSGRNVSKKKSAAKQKSKKEEEEVDELNQMVVRILHISESPTAITVKVSAEVKDIRPYIVCCIVKGMNLRQGNSLKRFLVAQVTKSLKKYLSVFLFNIIKTGVQLKFYKYFCIAVLSADKTP